jgi:hypothetical protein
LVGNPRLSPSASDGSQDLIPPVFLNRHHFNEAHEHVDMVYFARVIDGEVAPEEKGGLIDWFDEERLETNEERLKDVIRRYALAAIAHFRGDIQ